MVFDTRGSNDDPRSSFLWLCQQLDSKEDKDSDLYPVTSIVNDLEKTMQTLAI